MTQVSLQQQSTAGLKPELLLNINDRLQLIIKGTDEEVPTTYLSRVENICDGEITISWPTSRGIRAPVHDGDILSLFYTDTHAVYLLDACVLRRLPEPIPLVVARAAGSVQRIQRREYVRVPAMVDVRLSARVITAKPSRDAEAGTDFITTRTLDISGGGFAINHAASPRTGTLYDVVLSVPTLDEPLKMTAKVVRSESAVDPVRGVYFRIGFAFIQVKESVRRQIVSYVFRFQQSRLVEEKR